MNWVMFSGCHDDDGHILYFRNNLQSQILEWTNGLVNDSRLEITVEMASLLLYRKNPIRDVGDIV